VPFLAQLECPNREINVQLCPCTEKSCPNWAVCCLCVANHRGNATWPFTACQQGAKRPAETVDLPDRVPCPNVQPNAAECVCSYDACTRRGFCCACISNHWTEDGKGRVACFRD